MTLYKCVEGSYKPFVPADGYLHTNVDPLSFTQKKFIERLGFTIQMENEAYLSEHPEIIALLKLFISKMAQQKKRWDVRKHSLQFFDRPKEELESEIRAYLGIPSNVPFVDAAKKYQYKKSDIINLERDLNILKEQQSSTDEWSLSSSTTTQPNTKSSSFISLVTSDTTLPTPEPIPTPEPTISEVFFKIISNTVDKAIYQHVDEELLLYDTAYVELKKVVEEAMEIPVIEIKEDIAQLYFNAFKMFELHIQEQERIAAEIAWQKRMRKKMKRTLRRLNNFKGYETPPTPKSELSSHPSYLVPPQRPCICHPQIHYNRYPKDRFGIYLPSGEEFNDRTITVTPVTSGDTLQFTINTTEKHEPTVE